MRVSSEIIFVLEFYLPWDSMVAKCVSQVFPMIKIASLYKSSYYQFITFK